MGEFSALIEIRYMGIKLVGFCCGCCCFSRIQLKDIVGVYGAAYGKNTIILTVLVLFFVSNFAHDVKVLF